LRRFGEAVRQFLELLVARHEVGLAVHFHERADAAACVDVRLDEALAYLAARERGELGHDSLSK
jgi:hypothetical protein